MQKNKRLKNYNKLKMEKEKNIKSLGNKLLNIYNLLNENIKNNKLKHTNPKIFKNIPNNLNVINSKILKNKKKKN